MEIDDRDENETNDPEKQSEPPANEDLPVSVTDDILASLKGALQETEAKKIRYGIKERKSGSDDSDRRTPFHIPEPEIEIFGKKSG